MYLVYLVYLFFPHSNFEKAARKQKGVIIIRANRRLVLIQAPRTNIKIIERKTDDNKIKLIQKSRVTGEYAKT